MRIRLIPVLSVLVTTLFCTLPFTLTVAEAGQDHALRSPGETGVFSAGPGQAAAPSWSNLNGGSESLTTKPLLLAANGNDDRSGSNSSNDKNDKVARMARTTRVARAARTTRGKDDRDHKGDKDDKDKVYVCHLLPNGKFITQKLPKDTARKLVRGPGWILGKCEDVISPSH